MLAGAEGAVRIGRGRGVAVMDAGLLDGDALHRGGRPVVGAVDHDGDVMRARSRFAVGILHADGEAEFHLVAEHADLRLSQHGNRLATDKTRRLQRALSL